MVQPIVKSPSGSLKISPPAARFISAMEQDIVKCLTMQSCMTMLGMMHMTWPSCKKYLQENRNKMREMGQQQSPWQKCRIPNFWIFPSLGLIISRFYQLIQGMKCKESSCNGVPILRALKEVIISVAILLLSNWLIYFLGQAPNIHGKNHFVGCTHWCAGEKFEHLYAPIPTSVNETILFQLINNDPITSNEVGQYEGPCFSFRHPRHGKQKKCSQ